MSSHQPLRERLEQANERRKRRRATHEVPEIVLTLRFPEFQIERMLSPGAKMSTHLPWLEKYARSSEMVDAPTVMAPSAAAGE